MNKIAISLIALAALSTASFATENNNGKEANQVYNQSVDANAMVVIKKTTSAPTAFERFSWIDQDRDRGGNR